MSKLLAKLVALVLATTFFFVVIEVSLRVIYQHSMDFDIEMWKYARELKRASGLKEIGHEHVPGRKAFLMGSDVRINAKGLRGAETDYDAPGVTRVLMLGDSLAFGWGVAEQDTTSVILENLLKENSGGQKTYEVINAGVGNYNTEMEVAYFLTKGINFNPQVVVLNYFINDAEPTPARTKNFFLSWSYAYVYLAGRIDALLRMTSARQGWDKYYSGLYANDRLGWAKTQKAISRLAELCREKGIRLILANYPELHNIEEYPFIAEEKKIAAVAKEHDIPYINLLGSLSGVEASTLWVTPADSHPNKNANELFGRALYEALFLYFPQIFTENSRGN